MITQQLLNELFEYKNGFIFWKVNMRPVKAGRKAGTLQKDNYTAVSFFGIRERAHRVIWIMHNGEIQEGFKVDHRDGDPSNNLISNLRLATKAQNEQNAGKRITNTSGFKGVSPIKTSGRWRATITAERKLRHLGVFPTPELAHEAYKQAAKKYHGEFAHW